MEQDTSKITASTSLMWKTRRIIKSKIFHQVWGCLPLTQYLGGRDQPGLHRVLGQPGPQRKTLSQKRGQLAIPLSPPNSYLANVWVAIGHLSPSLSLLVPVLIHAPPPFPVPCFLSLSILRCPTSIPLLLFRSPLRSGLPSTSKLPLVLGCG